MQGGAGFLSSTVGGARKAGGHKTSNHGKHLALAVQFPYSKNSYLPESSNAWDSMFPGPSNKMVMTVT